jgi:ribosomal protein L32E
MTQSKNYRRELNQQIRQYWLSVKPSLNLKVLKKKRKPSFTRHNGNRIVRLKDKWTYPKGLHGNKITVPSIGHKRNALHRFRRHVDGLLFKMVNCIKDLEQSLKPKEVFMFSHRLSARSRKLCLERAKELKVPVFINKIHA